MTKSNLKPIIGVGMLVCAFCAPALLIGWLYVVVLAAVVGLVAWVGIAANLIAGD